MSEPTPTKRKPRAYRRITPNTVAKFNAAVIAHGNGSAAVRAIEPETINVGRRAWLIVQKSKELNATEYIDHQMQQTAIEATERVRVMVQSPDEKIATKNAHFVIDHIRGKALQRSESKTLNINIETLLAKRNKPAE